MDIYHCGAAPSRRMLDEWFTGTVWQEPVIEAPTPARVRSSFVHFEPGAHTNWHTHPLGQTLCIVYGIARIQSWGGPLREVRAGDVVWFGPNEKHWHGAGPATNMVHLAIQEALDGTHVDWLEKVTDEQYKADVTR